jgi:hypothetical protein
MNDTQAAAFLALVAPDRRDRTAEALAAIAVGLNGQIMNVDFKDAKLTLDRSMEYAFDAIIGPFWHGKGGTLDADPVKNEALNKFWWSVNLHHDRDAIATSNKLSKTTLQHPMIDAIRSFVDTVHPVAVAMEKAKQNIVKGRRPNPEAEARRFQKSLNAMPRATCACCFDNQAVLPNGNIHDHGYRIVRAWNKTRSCPGRQFKPLEVSNEGLKYMVRILTAYQTSTKEEIRKAPALTKLSRTNFRGDVSLYTPSTPGWAEVYSEHVTKLQRSLQGIEADLETFKQKLTHWAPAA